MVTLSQLPNVIVPEASVGRSVVQAIPNGAWAILFFDVERLDTDGIHDLAVNLSRLTCRTPGRYDAWGTVAFAANVANMRALMLTKNSGGVAGAGTILQEDSRQAAAGVSGFHTSLAVSRKITLIAGDYVELHVFQDSGGALNINTAAEWTPEFGMRWLGPTR